MVDEGPDGWITKAGQSAARMQRDDADNERLRTISALLASGWLAERPKPMTPLRLRKVAGTVRLKFELHADGKFVLDVRDESGATLWWGLGRLGSPEVLQRLGQEVDQ